MWRLSIAASQLRSGMLIRVRSHGYHSAFMTLHLAMGISRDVASCRSPGKLAFWARLAWRAWLYFLDSNPQPGEERTDFWLLCGSRQEKGSYNMLFPQHRLFSCLPMQEAASW